MKTILKDFIAISMTCTSLLVLAVPAYAVESSASPAASATVKPSGEDRKGPKLKSEKPRGSEKARPSGSARGPKNRCQAFEVGVTFREERKKKFDERAASIVKLLTKYNASDKVKADLATFNTMVTKTDADFDKAIAAAKARMQTSCNASASPAGSPSASTNPGVKAGLDDLFATVRKDISDINKFLHETVLPDLRAYVKTLKKESPKGSPKGTPKGSAPVTASPAASATAAASAQ